MPDCTVDGVRLSDFKRRVVEARFDGGAITSDGGSLLLREVERRTGLLRDVSRRLTDARSPRRCVHDAASLLRQRVFGVALGYCDLNDHGALRRDIAFQTAVSRDQALASASTLCRFEQAADTDFAWAAHAALFERFCASFKTPPKRLTLDFDATDDRVHGEQAGRYFNGFYDGYCFLPLYVFCGDQLLVSYLRSAARHGAHHAAAILRLLVHALRARWPDVEIVLRADAGFCTPRILHACQRLGIDYILGFAVNDRLKRLSAPWLDAAEIAQRRTGQPARFFTEDRYRARSWKRSSRLLVKAEHNGVGRNARFVITSLAGDPQWLYEAIYCARGDMENRIKEQQLDLYADRTSAHDWWANQMRLLFAGLAYALMDAIRDLALAGTRWARISVGTLRLRLLKIGAVVWRNTRRVRLHLSSHYPDPGMLRLVVARLKPG
ncbi:IS1380 family transposase [Salinisphaera orenii]|uniref:IS1380 family transposase n=1 Tax=Salinisphaera orenii TaxID=856731 RepID=UPI000F476B11|nr:IS1380 family transposase [Salinisphaera halophila]